MTDVIKGALQKAYNEPYGTSSYFKILAFLKYLRDEGPDERMIENDSYQDGETLIYHLIERLEEENK